MPRRIPPDFQAVGERPAGRSRAVRPDLTEPVRETDTDAVRVPIGRAVDEMHQSARHRVQAHPRIRGMISHRKSDPHPGRTEGIPVRRLKLVLFVLDTYSKMAIDKAGADWVGGDMRRARAAARQDLLNEAMDGLLHRGGPAP
jgi:hypothetical protein